MQETKSISLLLFDGFSNLCLANAVEPLRAANTLARSTLYSWAFLSLGAEELFSSSGLPVSPQPMTPADKGDALFVMPSYRHETWANAATARALRGASQRFERMVGLDTGAYLLAHAGLLDGRRATCHWDILEEASETFPQVTFTQDRYMIDGNRASCGGATTTLDLMLALIEKDHGATLALEVAALFMYGERDPLTDPKRLIPDHRKIQAAAALMRRHIENPIPLADIAKGVGLSQRGLELAFRTHAGLPPARLYRSIRLAEARRRMEQTRDSVAEVALRAGYKDATAMTRAFKAEFGITPSAARAAKLSEGGM
ncbi:GlxA family transcriptional regulator [Gymnodinialimonas hymeniacidonis]|uniref:GlxA family transcriptional regulator n=1 Tax=Gymnodinialimonas hymeniacidonis TaxID=3126508 RepID=UPI0034C626CF